MHKPKPANKTGRPLRTLDKAELASATGGDVYMHNPPGSNDRNRN